MYELGLKRRFIARHHLPGGPPGEREPHSHDYCVEARVGGERVDERGYVFDIVELRHTLDSLLGKYQDQYLNNLPDLKGLNPSIENLARVICERLCEKINPANAIFLEIRLWESDEAWASYRIELHAEKA